MLEKPRLAKGKRFSAEKLPSAYTSVQPTSCRMEAKKVLRRVKKAGNFHVLVVSITLGVAQRTLIDGQLAQFGRRTQPQMVHLIESGKLAGYDVKHAEKERKRLSRKVKKG